MLIPAVFWCMRDDVQGQYEVWVFALLVWWMNKYSLLENNSDLIRELVEQNFDDNLFRCTDYRPVLQKIVLWQAHHHSYAVGHGRPYLDPFSKHLQETRRQRTEFAKKELCFMTGITATLSTNLHRKCFCCISEQQCSLKSCLRGLQTFFQFRPCLRPLSSTLPEQSNSEDVSLSMS